jgi:hypothetical protein
MGEEYNFNMLLIYSDIILQYYLSVSVCACCRIFIQVLHPRWVILYQIMTGHSLTPSNLIR